MSLETKQAMEAAMAAHFADEMDGAIQVGYWLTMKGSDLDRPDSTAYHYCGPDTQSFDVSLGLQEMANKYLDMDYRESMR